MLRALRNTYDQIPDTMCPLLNKTLVTFNAIGWKHVSRKPRKRNRKDVFERLNLLKYAPRIISDPRATVSYRKGITFDLKVVQYWALDKIIDNKPLRVIIRQVGDGQKHFYSIMIRGTKNPA